MDKIQQDLEKKLLYYRGQLEKSIEKFIGSNKRVDRDMVIVHKTKVAFIKEILTSVK